MATKPTPPDIDGTVDDWHEFKDLYAGWLQTASDEEILAEMAALGEVEGPLSPSERWRFHECEQRRKQPRSTGRASRSKPKES